MTDVKYLRVKVNCRNYSIAIARDVENKVISHFIYRVKS